MPRFKKNLRTKGVIGFGSKKPVLKGVIGLGSKKTGAKRCLYASVEQTRSQKVTSLASGGTEPGPNSLIRAKKREPHYFFLACRCVFSIFSIFFLTRTEPYGNPKP